MKGKTVVITGANTGIGKETAIGLATMGATVVLACRNREKAEIAATEIGSRGGSDDVHLVDLDLADLDSVASAATEVLDRFDRLDVLINNAGLQLKERTHTKQGFETTFGVNHLGHFLLTDLLLDRIRASAPARIVNLSSVGHNFARGGLPWDDLQHDITRYTANGVYCESKLANILLTRELARRLPPEEVTANAVHPGAVRSEFGSSEDMGRLYGAFMKAGGPFLISSKSGARTSIYLASSPEVAGKTGGYYVRRRLHAGSKASRDMAAAKRLWETSEELLASVGARLTESIDQALAATATRDDLVVDERGRWSSAQLAERVAAVAGGLRAHGVARGDTVSWQLANLVDAVVLYRACWRLGAIAAPIHHLAGGTDVERITGMVRPRVVIDGPLPSSDPIVEPATDPELVGVVLFTSGSSGQPKGVIHTQGRLAYKARLMASVHGLTADDAILMPAPLAHISGLLNGVTVPGVVPMKTVLMAKWDPVVALEVIARERITFMIGPPTFFVGLMNAPGFSPRAVESLRLVSSGGAGVTPAFVASARAALGCEVKRTYGSTEAPTVTTSQPGDDPEKAASTDGRPTGAVELRVAENGELLVRGPELFVGYLDTEQTTAAFTDDGWFHTGDVGRVDDGWLTITGRIKDIIIRGGENIATAEVEGVLEAHPAVAHAVAIGVPDARLGEQVVAFVSLKAGTTFDLDDCRSWFESQGVARFKTPERVVVVGDIPVMAAGKPDREALRRLL